MIYDVLNTYTMHVKTKDNPYDFHQEELFEMAVRMNKKRCFLFVSKVLGKHLAVHPAIPILTGHLLAIRFQEQASSQEEIAQDIAQALKGHIGAEEVLKISRKHKLEQKDPLLVIGFAETATALGHGFFEKISGCVHYIHTTREHLVNQQPTICFEEEHSHATSHRLYAEQALFEGIKKIALVDDEMTTGKTNCNIIRQLKQTYPQIKEVVIATILDFRDDEARKRIEQLAKELEIVITCVSLFSANFLLQEKNQVTSETDEVYVKNKITEKIDNLSELLQGKCILQASYSDTQKKIEAKYYNMSGRFQLSASNQQQVEGDSKMLATHLKEKRKPGKCLVLGTGEFMYVPMMIANEMGPDVYYHATTRSPIYANEQYAIYNRFTFNSPEFPGITNYLYNIPQNTYTDIFIIYERILDMEAACTLYDQLKQYAKNVHIVTLGGVYGEI